MSFKVVSELDFTFMSLFKQMLRKLQRSPGKKTGRLAGPAGLEPWGGRPEGYRAATQDRQGRSPALPSTQADISAEACLMAAVTAGARASPPDGQPHPG